MAFWLKNNGLSSMKYVSTYMRHGFLKTPFLSAVTQNQRRTIETSCLNPSDILTEDEMILRDSVAKFAKEVILPKVKSMDENEQLDSSIIKQMFDQGYMAVDVDTKYSGSGLGFMSVVVLVEQLARVDASMSVFCDVQNTIVNSNFKFASEKLKEKYLPQLATEKVGAFCLSEPSSGSDAFALRTRARKTDDDHYILSGNKMWITNGAEAEIFIVFANVKEDFDYKGITAFIVEKSMGVEVLKKEKKVGIKASSTALLGFDEVKVPKENILGEIGQGYKIAISTLNEGRIGIAAQAIGIAAGAFDIALKYCLSERQQFNKYIGDFQGMRFQFAQSAMELRAAQLLTYNAARLRDQGHNVILEGAMAKLYASQVAQKITSNCIDWMGGAGFTCEVPVEKFWRDSKICTIYEGTSNIQLDTIGKVLAKEYKS